MNPVANAIIKYMKLNSEIYIVCETDDYQECKKVVGVYHDKDEAYKTLVNLLYPDILEFHREYKNQDLDNYYFSREGKIRDEFKELFKQYKFEIPYEKKLQFILNHQDYFDRCSIQTHRIQ